MGNSTVLTCTKNVQHIRKQQVGGRARLTPFAHARRRVLLHLERLQPVQQLAPQRVRGQRGQALRPKAWRRGGRMPRCRCRRKSHSPFGLCVGTRCGLCVGTRLGLCVSCASYQHVSELAADAARRQGTALGAQAGPPSMLAQRGRAGAPARAGAYLAPPLPELCPLTADTADAYVLH